MGRFERLSVADLSNLAVEAPDTPMHQGALGVVDGGPLMDADGRVAIGRVRSHLQARLERVPQLRRILYETGPLQGRPLWVDDPTFRIENHVLVAQLPPPGGETEGLKFAEAAMASLMDRSRPLWQLWFLEGYGQGKVGIFLKLHHVFADGPAILNIIGLLFDLEPGILDSPAPWSPSPPPAASALALDNLARKARAVKRATKRLAHPALLGRSAGAAARAIWSALEEGRGAPRTSINRPIGPKRRVGVVRLSLAEVKSVAHESGVKVNDVFLDLVAGGLRAVLVSRGSSVDDTDIRASMAVSLHSSQNDVVGNHVGTMIVPLPLGEADGAMRLRVIAAHTARAKASQRGAVPQALMAALALSGLMRFFIRRQHLVNVLVTNLSGPQFPLYVAGARLLDAVPIPPIAGNVTASFAALSYDGNLDLSVHADRDAWPDLEVGLEGMRSTWRELRTGRAMVAAAEGLSALSA
jgi:diacylglycerol O-acyltransferase / wax synthase